MNTMTVINNSQYDAARLDIDRQVQWIRMMELPGKHVLGVGFRGADELVCGWINISPTIDNPGNVESHLEAVSLPEAIKTIRDVITVADVLDGNVEMEMDPIAECKWLTLLQAHLE